MGTGSEVEAGGLRWDVPAGVGVGEWCALSPAADRSTTRSLQKGRGTRVRGYTPGDGPGLHVRYVPKSTSVPGIRAGQVL